MKRLYLTGFAIALTLGISMAQDEYDALRYSQYFFGGTARVAGMAGAYGALGGDFGSLSINPAGLGVYRSTEFTLTPALSFDRTDARYLGSSITDAKAQFSLGNLGFVSTRKTGKESGFVSVSYGFGYNQLNNFNRNTFMQGRMPEVDSLDLPVSTERPEYGGSRSSSYLDNFVNYANDVWFNPNNLDPYYEQLALDCDLIYPDTSWMSYRNDINDVGYGQFQQQTVSEHGGLGEFVFGAGANYSDVLYLGVTFGIHQLRFHQNISTFEEDDLDKSYYFNSFTFNEYLDVYGTGFTAKFGLIYRPVSFIRVGAAFHIPTFYRIREEFSTDLSGTFDEGATNSERSPLHISKYWLRTPYRVIGSVAFQFPKIATINVDYELVDYSIMNFDSDYPEDFIDVNQSMKNMYKLTSNLRAGAEVVIKPIYLRAGFAFYGSPYEDKVPGISTYNLLYSGGLGFRSEKFFFDIGGTVRTNELRHELYEEDAFNSIISGRKANFMATLGFRF
jgi:hypothetical protein